MAKPKLNFQDLLLKKGEYVALGAAGLGLGLLLLMGVTRGLGSENPEAIGKELTQASQNVHSAITRDGDKPKDLDPRVVGDTKVYPAVPAADFPLLNVHFDPTAKPNLKRENPRVLGLGLNALDPNGQPYPAGVKAYQVDLVRAPMKGFDIVTDVGPDGKQLDSKIAVVTTKPVGKQDEKSVKEALKQIGDQLRRQRGGRPLPKGTPTGGQPQPPGFAGQPPPGGGGKLGGLGGPGMGPMGGMGGPGMGGMAGPGGMMGGGKLGGMGMGGLGMPGMGGGFDSSAQRTDKVVEYVSLDKLDEAMAANKLPAMTVVPLRMVVVNATFPLKDQVEEVRKALRMKNLSTAAQVVQQFGFNGFNVRRRVILPNGVIAGWPAREDGTLVKLEDVVKDKEQNEKVGFFPYDYEAAYTEKIDTRKLADHFEGGEDEAYLPYFYRYEDSLVMPFPELVGEAVGGNTYPKVGLQPIVDTIAKLRQAKVVPQDPSELLKRLQGKGGEGDGRRGRFNPKSADAGAGGTGAGTIFGKNASQGPSLGGKGKGLFKDKIDPKDKKKDEADAPVDIDHLLLRFIDCDVRPGYTYQYQIQVELVNPNWNQAATMANPALAGDDYKVLKGDWVMLEDPLTVPDESFLFAADPAQYRQQVAEEYRGQPALLRRLQAKEGQAVVEVMAWTEQVKTDAGGQREPVGAWVVAEMPVGPGEYVGKKTFVPLPLWSSEQNQYVLRELSAEKVVKGGPGSQPKGWLVDFSSRSVLVDFDGGKVRTKAGNGRYVEDEVTTELLIVKPDGSLQVRSAAADAADPNRQKIEADWKKWVENVKANRQPAGTTPGGNQFDRKPAGGSGGNSNTPGTSDN